MEQKVFSLQDRIDDIRRLLQRFRLETHVVEISAQRRPPLERALVERQHGVELQRRIASFHTADLAQLLEQLPADERRIVWDNIPASRRGEVMLELSDAVLDNVLTGLTRDELVAALRELEPDDLTYLSDAIPAEVFHAALDTLTKEDRSWVNATITYDDDRVGHLMSGEMIVVRPQQTLKSVQEQLRTGGELPEHTDKLFVVDLRGHLTGALYLQDILLNDAEMRVAAVMKEKMVRFQPEDELDEAARAFERYDLVSAPVVNERGKLIGRLTVDEVMDYVREASEMDALNVAGVVESEDLFANVWASARNRWLWLGVNLCTAFVVSRIIGNFEGTISKMVALASLMPIVASVSGNTGTQTTALVIRSLATGQLNRSNLWHLIRKELTIAILNGLVWGVIVGLFAFVFYHELRLSAVLSTAMAFGFLLGAVIGVGAPVLLERLGRDPAMGSSVILTAMTDAMSFFITLALATLFLV